MTVRYHSSFTVLGVDNLYRQMCSRYMLGEVRGERWREGGRERERRRERERGREEGERGGGGREGDRKGERERERERGRRGTGRIHTHTHSKDSFINSMKETEEFHLSNVTLHHADQP